MREPIITSKGSRSRRNISTLIWSGLTMAAAFLWYGRLNGTIHSSTADPVAFLLAAYAALSSIFAWMLYSPNRRSSEQSVALFVSGAVTLLPPCVIAFCLMPSESPYRLWLTFGVFVLTMVSVTTPVPDEFFAVPRDRGTYLRPISDALFSQLSVDTHSSTFILPTAVTLITPGQRVLTEPAGSAWPVDGRDPWTNPFQGTGISPVVAGSRARRTRTRVSQPPAPARQPPVAQSSASVADIRNEATAEPATTRHHPRADSNAPFDATPDHSSPDHQTPYLQDQSHFVGDSGGRADAAMQRDISSATQEADLKLRKSRKSSQRPVPEVQAATPAAFGFRPPTPNIWLDETSRRSTEANRAVPDRSAVAAPIPSERSIRPTKESNPLHDPDIAKAIPVARVATPTADTSPPESEPSDELQLERISDEYGGEMIEGTARIFFHPGQKKTNLHIPFSPALPGIPEVECESVGHEVLRLKVPVRQSYGIRIEARRSDTSEALETEVGFAAVYTPPNRRTL